MDRPDDGERADEATVTTMTPVFRTSFCLPLLAVSTLCHAQTPARPAAAAPVSASRLDAVRMLREREFDLLDRAIRSLEE